ncbi:MAG: RidA family protein [Cyclobacteriaceae bacterium]
MQQNRYNNKGRSFELNNPESLSDPSSLAYSHLGAVPAGQQLIFVAGQSGTEAGPEDFTAQCIVALNNVEKVMSAAGGELKDIVKWTIFIVDHNEIKHRIIIEEIQKRFGDLFTPACSLVPVPRLATPDALIEIEAIGAIDTIDRPYPI